MDRESRLMPALARRPGLGLLLAFGLAVLLAALVVAALAAPSAGAISRAHATRLALRALAPSRAGHDVVVDGTLQRLPAGTVVGDSGPSPGARLRTVGPPSNQRLQFRPTAYKLRAPGWVFWEDFAPGAEFSHPSRLIVLDDRSGRIVFSRALGFYPLIGRRPAGFLAHELAKPSRVYPTRITTAHTASLDPALAASLDPGLARETEQRGPPPSTTATVKYGPGDCLVTAGDRETPTKEDTVDFGPDFDSVEAAARQHGIQSFPATGADLEAAVQKAVQAGCIDIWLYIAGHGLAPPGTPKVNGHSVRTSDQPTVLAGHLDGANSPEITAETIAALTTKFPQITFKVTVESCFSGRFVSALINQHGIVFVGASSGADQVSYGFPFTYHGVEHRRPAGDTNNAGSYTYGLVTAFDHIDPLSVGADLAKALAKAQNDAAKNGDVAASVGATTPAATAPKVYTLHITYGGDGYGGVGLNPAVGGSTCGSLPCSERFAPGTTVTLGAEPAPGSYFGGFSGGGCSGLLEPCTVTINGDVNIIAFFYRSPRYELVVSTSGTGSGTVTTLAPYDNPPRIQCPTTCAYVFAEGSVVSLKATPSAGSTFAGWNGGGCAGVGGCTVTVNGNTAVNAVFNTTGRVSMGGLSNGSGELLAYSFQTNEPANAFQLTLPAGDDISGVSFPAGFSGSDCSESGNVLTCLNGTVAADQPLSGSFDHTGTIAADCGCVEVAFSTDDGMTWSAPTALTGPPSSSPAAPPAFECTGSPTVLFNNFNGDLVDNGGTEPSFSTSGSRYCLVSVSTYHWNGGSGATPGTIALASEGGTLGPWPATGSSGSGGAPNVNWTVTPGSPSDPVIIDGTYACDDSSPGTWSQNTASSGQGFCKVTVENAVASG